MPGAVGLTSLHRELVQCTRCPRLTEHRQHIGQVKRRAYREQEYWARPVPGFGDPRAKLVIMGLAPGAHGANRTGRMFTGDRSGDFLYAGLHRAGFANQPVSRAVDDGLKLTGAFITAPVRCVPPDNLPTGDEIATCRKWLERELAVLQPKVFLALGAIGWAAVLEHLDWPTPRPKFAHGAVVAGAVDVVGCYHVSQQNTQTGRLTAEMFDAVMGVVKARLR